ncbi:MAG: arginine--tRNA ligase [Sulfurimicrobium sp.]|nr:arginine--tRNA ligase [Sulfurimicrobium sp.]MDP1703179.1 arginine--tRNA ligase [Sulfurimicrobium sp.]MDP2197676.1 arginine--tRNA ligase [Sulfurimicrobium sp.]MDP3688999.1 arginine--tRNA ligase [Sulfurimicrobium sp.]
MKQHLTDLFAQALRTVAPEANDASIILERPKQAQHGDYACNLAMQLARALKRNPREIAVALLDALPASPWVEKAEIAGAGFINIFLSAASKQRVVGTILQQGPEFGRGQVGKGKKAQVEFVSANPTGPLHVGHGRGAAFGMSLSNVLAAAGFEVKREYYINDAGRQMDILALSTWLRYLELNGISVPFPANAYQGQYVRDMAGEIRRLHGDRYVHQPWTLLEGVPPRSSEEELEEDEKWAKQQNELHLDGLIANAKKLLGDDYAYIHDFALTEQLGDGRNDLMEFGVTFDIWFSEKSLFDSGLVQRAVETLQNNGHLYQQDGALWFRSTAFGDEKDRVVQRENGQYTYFASDIAYHLNKFERGFDHIINVWGADHHGYIPRVKGALKALGLDDSRLEVALVQFAVLYRGEEKVSMSTRSGDFVTLRELRHEVGNDACRFFYVLRKSDQHLDFDLELAKSQSNDNPVYYIQYAHARICSVLAQWGGDLNDLAQADLTCLHLPHELALLQRLEAYPETLENAAREFAPHYIAYYLKDLAGELHSYYNAQQFLVEDEAIKLARLALITATREVIRNGLTLLGVNSPEKM